MSAFGVIPPTKLEELIDQHRRAKAGKRTGTIKVILRYHNGDIVKAAVVPEFEDDVRELERTA